jgi:predicted nucleic acid-binding protein
VKILFDTNVVLDVMLERTPHLEQATFLLSKVEAGVIEGYLCATTITTLDYLMKKALGAEKAKILLHTLLQLFEITPVNRLVLEGALAARMSDFEDSILHESALHANLHGIVTRDKIGYKQAKLSVYTPQELVDILSKVVTI